MKVPSVATKDLLTVTDLTAQEIHSLFRYAKWLKKKTRKGSFPPVLKGRTLGMIFEKSSTRTRVSFETGIYQLGGSGLFLSSNDLQLGRGETVADTARVLSRYLDGIMIRTFSQADVEELAAEACIPVINGLTDTYHPCQTLSDFFTIWEHHRNLDQIKVAFIGDGNNMAHSLLLTAALLGTDISIAAPKKYSPDMAIVERAYRLSSASGARITVTEDITEAVSGAHYIYTDVWASMGQEKETAKRKRAFKKYQVSMDLVRKAAPECRVMHCLPAHRGEEITDEVMDSPERSIVFDQAENRLHMQKAVMASLMAHRRYPKGE